MLLEPSSRQLPLCSRHCLEIGGAEEEHFQYPNGVAVAALRSGDLVSIYHSPRLVIERLHEAEGEIMADFAEAICRAYTFTLNEAGWASIEGKLKTRDLMVRLERGCLDWCQHDDW